MYGKVQRGPEQEQLGAHRASRCMEANHLHKASDTAQMLEHAPALDEPSLHQLEEKLAERHQLRTANLANLAKSTEAARSFAKIKWRQAPSLLEVATSSGHSKSLGAAPSSKDVQVVVQRVEWRSDVHKSRGEGANMFDFCDGPSSGDPCCVVRSATDLAEQEKCNNCGVPSTIHFEMDGPSVDG